MITAPEMQKELICYFNNVGKQYFSRKNSVDEFAVASHEQHIDLFDESTGELLCDLTLWDGLVPISKGWTLFNPAKSASSKDVATIAYIKDDSEEGIDAACYFGIYINESEKIHFREKNTEDCEELDGIIYIIKSQRLDELLKSIFDIKRERMKEISEQRTIAGFNDAALIESLQNEKQENSITQ